MPHFIKTGFWEKSSKTFKGWLNLEQLITSIAGGVQSVTGDGVDNTDPANPVISFPTPGEIAAQPADSDLTAIAALTPSNDDFIQRKAGAWTNRSISQVLTDLGGYLIKRNTNSSTLTGSTSETLVDSLTVPANTLQANDVLRIALTATKSGTAGNYTLRLYVNTSASLSGATLLAQSTGGTTILWQKLQRELVFKNSVSSQEIFPSGAAINFDVANQATAITTLTTDYTVQQFFIVSIQLGNAGDSAILRNWYIEVLR